MLAVLLVVASLAGCVQQTVPTGTIVTNTSEELEALVFQPVQCQTTPWDQWYSEGNIQFAREPSASEIAVPYYAEQGITIHSFERVESDMMVCTACNICPTAHFFEATVSEEEADALEAQGWERG